ncbi:MAG TPA: GntR family transcriptional regulator [Acidobacteriaceae bacterium]|jgi:GntR family transcriptional regulator
MTASAPAKASEFRFRLDAHSGVPVYRQLIDQVLAAVARGALRTGDQLPTVRQVAVDLAINPNTVMRAYREMEIREILDTQQGSGTFIAETKTAGSGEERERQMEQLVVEFVARGGSLGFTAQEMIRRLREMVEETASRRK